MLTFLCFPFSLLKLICNSHRKVSLKVRTIDDNGRRFLSTSEKILEEQNCQAKNKGHFSRDNNSQKVALLKDPKTYTQESRIEHLVYSKRQTPTFRLPSAVLKSKAHQKLEYTKSRFLTVNSSINYWLNVVFLGCFDGTA